MNSDEKLALLALAKGFREVLAQIRNETTRELTAVYDRIDEVDKLIEQLTEE